MDTSKGKAVVKSVLNGDTLVLKGKAINGPPPEMVLQLTLINAPRLGGKTEQEEPFAFESREYLRELLVGKEIEYSIEYTSPTQRYIGTVKMSSQINNQNDLGKIVVSAGWAKVRSGSKSISEYQSDLHALEDAAKIGCHGIWQNSSVHQKVAYNWDSLSPDPRAFIANNKEDPIPAIIEQVRDGSTFRCVLLLPDRRQWITLSLSGIVCPVLRKGVPNMDDLIEPFAEEAKYFTECRLLQRKVDILLEGTSGNLSFFGTILHPKGNISELLLSEGFAKIIDWNLGIVKSAKAYRDAESVAKKKQLRIWKAFALKKGGDALENGPGKDYPALVTRIISPDILMVEAGGTERKVGFSSIRGPKRMKNEAGYDVGYFFEAQEFLRSRLIGSKVLVKTDYVKPKDGEFEERECVTLVKNEKNISEILVRAGLAQVIKHKKDDNNRSSSYDILLRAEEDAKSAEKGLFSKKEAPINRIVDASENITKARSFIAMLSRNGATKGIVEYVWSASRFKIWLPSHNCRITFILAGVITPRPPGNRGQKGEPFGVEAAQFSSKRIFQREVEINVEGQDKVGGFIGTLVIKQQNLGVLLLNEGLASTHHHSASQSPTANQLFAAELSAKDTRKGIWEHTSVETVEIDQLTLEQTPASKDAVVVSEIGKDGKLFLQYTGPELTQLARMMKEFAEYHVSAASSFVPKIGEYCSAQFTADNQWYRAKIVNAQNAYTVVYIDYGNSEDVPISRLRTLSPNFSVSKLKAQAIESSLAFIDLPSPGSEYSHAAFDALCHLTEGKTLNATSAGGLCVLLFDKDGISIQEKLIREGLATITKDSMKKHQFEIRQRLKNPAILTGDLDSLVKAQEETARKRLNVWEYGDLGLYDELE